MRSSLPIGLLVATAISLAPSANAGLIGDAGITWLYPNTSTTYAADTIVVGSSLNCPGSSPICNGYVGDGGSPAESFGVASTSITYSAANNTSSYADVSFNGFDFTGLTFADSGSLTSFTLSTNISGLTASDVSFTAHSIEIDLANLPVDGSFTLNLSESASSVPEPGFLAPVGVALGGLAFLKRRRRATIGRIR